MFRPKVTTLIFLIVGLVVIAPAVRAQEGERSEREAMYYRYLEFPSYVKGGSVQPHWMADGSSFWYAEGAPANTVIYKVDPKANTKTPLFDGARLRDALTPLLGHEPPYHGLPFDKFTFVDKSEKAVKFTVENKELTLQLDSYAITRAPALSEEEKSRLVPQIVRKGGMYGQPEMREVLSPDRRWFAHLKDHNLYLRSTYDGRIEALTTDGVKDYEWVGQEVWEPNWAWWSPDSFKLAVKKEDKRKMPKRPLVHWLKPTEEVEWGHRAIAGGAIPQTELFVVEILSKQQVRVNTGDEPDQYISILGWRPDGSELLFVRFDRDHKKLVLMAAKPATGSTRVVFTEARKTFFPPQWARSLSFTLLEDGKRFIWRSERDGWNHLYLYDLDRTLLRRLTEGTFPVVRVVTVDEKAGWVYFTAHGDKQRPYGTHLYRASFDGKGSTRLTETPGQHDTPSGWTPGFLSTIQFSPSKEFFLSTHSSINRPPAVELRRADGTLLQILSKANIDALKAELKWSPPEEFVVKAADGKTDLYGVLYKPYDFDPNKKYPVIEWVYAGPQTAWVPRAFTDLRGVWPQALAQLGFITFIVDARGTPGRGKRFQDVVYGNFGRYEIPDHVATLKQLAEKRSYMDFNRVGVYGASWGGYMTLRAMFLAAEVYHVGVALAPVVEPYLDAATHEPYIGLPQNNKEGYEYASNLRLAGNLKGKLLLSIGTSDFLFSHTMKMVDALIRADKPFDLLVLPEQSHGPTGRSGKYWREAIRRYFQEHLKP